MVKRVNLLLILAIFAVFSLTLSGCGKKPTQTTGNANQAGQPATNQAAEQKSSASINDLMLSGKPVKCAYSYADEGTQLSGTVYVSGKKFFQEAVINAEGKKTTVNSISDSVWIYTWSPDEPMMAFKMKISEMEDLQDKSQTNDQTQNVDLDKKINYDCSNWGVDNSKFVPPSGVKFTDMAELLKQVQGATGAGSAGSGQNSQLCASCDQVGDAAQKQQCRSALGCQ